jgi:hypothetical protein
LLIQEGTPTDINVDELLIFAFSEFRQSAIRNHVEIKRLLEDAAKAVSPYTTADALVQQLTKRRAKLLQQRKRDREESIVSTGKKVLAMIPKKTPKALDTLPSKVSSTKRKANIKVDYSDPIVVEPKTPTSETFITKRKSSRAKNEILSYDLDDNQFEYEIDSLPDTPLPAEEEHIESEYIESPLKNKNKRAPVADNSAIKKAKAMPTTRQHKPVSKTNSSVVTASKASVTKKISETKNQAMDLLVEDLNDPYAPGVVHASENPPKKIAATPRICVNATKETSLRLGLPVDIAERYPFSVEAEDEDEFDLPAMKLDA